MVGLEPLFDAAANLSFALQVSDLGQVVGTSSSNSSGDLQAVIWEGSTFASPLGSTSSSASGITPDGSVIVGRVGATPVRWVKVNGAWTELALPGQADVCFTVVIAGDGTIAGTCEIGKGPASVVVWRNGVLTELGTGSAIAVNANQQVLVRVGDESFIWDLRTSPMTITPLGSLGGTRTSASDINDLGHVVGSSQNAAGVMRPFLWTVKKGMVDLGTIGGDRGTASAINNSGQIVGLSDLQGTTLAHATYWYKGKIHDLGVLSGYESSSATDINASGQIVGGSGSGSNHRATLWTLDAK
jgi:probable HAF family extracellular repeat protein